MKITNHKFVGVPYKKSPNTSGTFASGMPDSIIIHYTAGASAESSIDTLCKSGSQASAHLVVAKDGGITQLVPFNTVAWHAGKSYYDGRSGYNKYSIGIEIDNPGRLNKSGDKYYSWFGKEYPPEMVYEGVHRNESSVSYWYRYTQEQINAVFEICEVLAEKYGVKFILGHEEIAPDRKTDPGPAFPMEKLRERILDRDRNEDAPLEVRPTLKRGGIITARKLNIRSKPLLSAGTVAPPLSQGTIVDITEEKLGWYKVKIQLEGWVKKDYVKD